MQTNRRKFIFIININTQGHKERRKTNIFLYSMLNCLQTVILNHQFHLNCLWGDESSISLFLGGLMTLKGSIFGESPFKSTKGTCFLGGYLKKIYIGRRSNKFTNRNLHSNYKGLVIFVWYNKMHAENVAFFIIIN